MNSNTSPLSLRNNAVDIFQSGVAAADPYQAVKRCLLVEANRLQILLDDKGDKRTGNWTKIHLIAFGKAACPMMKAALDIIPTHLLGHAIAVTNYENVQPVHGVNVIGAGHPLPDEAGFTAAQQVAEIAQAAQAGELVLVLVSGGGSALIPYPVDSVTIIRQNPHDRFVAGFWCYHQRNQLRTQAPVPALRAEDWQN